MGQSYFSTGKKTCMVNLADHPHHYIIEAVCIDLCEERLVVLWAHSIRRQYTAVDGAGVKYGINYQIIIIIGFSIVNATL